MKKRIVVKVIILLVVAAGLGVYFMTRSQTISALNFTSADGSLSVRADKVTISGWFGSVVDMTNGYVDIFDRSESGQVSGKDLNMGSTFSRDHFSSFPGGKPSRIKAHPLAVKIYKGKEIVTQFFAAEGEIDVNKGLVVLAKEARSLSGNTLLIADKMVLSLAASTISAERFVLQKPDKRVEGSNLTLDVHLMAQTGAAGGVR